MKNTIKYATAVKVPELMPTRERAPPSYQFVVSPKYTNVGVLTRQSLDRSIKLPMSPQANSTTRKKMNMFNN